MAKIRKYHKIRFNGIFNNILVFLFFHYSNVLSHRYIVTYIVSQQQNVLFILNFETFFNKTIPNKIPKTFDLNNK